MNGDGASGAGVDDVAAQVAPEEMSLLGLVDHFRQIHEQMPDRAFAFLLGAGASKTSNIKTASEMVQDWVKTLHVRSGNTLGLEQWASAGTLRVSAYDSRNPAGAYAELYERMYRDDPGLGFAYLEHEMRNAEPSYGYSVLARILATTQHRVVITTNFDNLVGDSLAIFSRTYPLVCGHESLTPFIRAQLRRPLVVKVHRDLLLAPKSRPDELTSLPESYTRALGELLQRYTPIVIGYGGNDGSLMGLLKSLPPASLPGGIYWCYWQGGARPEESIQRLVADQNGHLVPIPGFDEVMLLLGDALAFDVPDKFVLDRANDRARRIVEQVKALRSKILGGTHPSMSDAATHDTSPPEQATAGPGSRVGATATIAPDSEQVTPALIQAVGKTMDRSDGEQRWWQWLDMAEAETDIDKRAAIYEAGIRMLPQSPELATSYANFLTDSWRDHDRAQQLYERALDVDPNNAFNLGNYADFLANIRSDYDRAQRLFERAIDENPTDPATLCNYTTFLINIRKDYNRVQQVYEQALAVNPWNAFNLGNYAGFELTASHVKNGLLLLRKALVALQTLPTRPLHAECWAYAYAHLPPPEQPAALSRLKTLVTEDGIRTGDWDFRGVFAEAVRRRHEASEWLPRLADVLGDKAPVSSLDAWDAWDAA